MSEVDAILDLRERIVDGMARLVIEAGRHPYGSTEQARLVAKKQGLGLALDYTRHALAVAGADR